MRGGTTTLTLVTALLAVTLLTPVAAYDWTQDSSYYDQVKPKCEDAVKRAVRSCFDSYIGWYDNGSNMWDFERDECRSDWNDIWCYFIVSSADKLGLVPSDWSFDVSNSYSNEWSEAKNAIRDYLINHQKSDGHWEYSDSDSASISCKAVDTARAILILLDTADYKNDKDVQNAIKKGLDWLFSNFNDFGGTDTDDLYAQSMSVYAMLRVFNLEVVKKEIDLYQDDSKFTQDVKGCVKTLLSNLDRLSNPWSELWDVNGSYTMSPVWTVLALAYAYRLSSHLGLSWEDRLEILGLLSGLVDDMINDPTKLNSDLRVTHVSHAVGGDSRQIPVWQVNESNEWKNDPYCTAMAVLILEIVKWFDIPITVDVPDWYVDYIVDWLCDQQETDSSGRHGWWNGANYYDEGENMTVVLALTAYVDPKAILGELPNPFGNYKIVVKRLSGSEYHVYIWDDQNGRPATVSMWGGSVEGNVVYFEADKDYFQTPFAHDILGRVADDSPDWGSVDSNPTLLGILESDGRHAAVTCDGGDAYLDESLWPTRDVDEDGKEDPTILWTAVGPAINRVIVPFLLQPRDRPNALLLAERPKSQDQFDVNGTHVDLSSWSAYVKLHLPKVRARAIYLLYTVCGPAESVMAKVHVRYEVQQEAVEREYEVKLLDWCTLSVDPDEPVVDVSHGVGLTLPDRSHFVNTPSVERKWVQIYATRIPANPSWTLDQLWLELTEVPAGRPCYVWLFALTIERDNDYLLVLGPDRWISIPKDRTPRLTVTLRDVLTGTTSYLTIRRMTLALASNDKNLYLDMDRVELMLYGIHDGESEDIEVKRASVGGRTVSGSELPDEVLKRLKDYRETQQGGFESDCEIVNLLGRVASGASSQDVTPIVLDVRVWSWDVIEDNQGGLVPASVVVTPGFTLAFSGYPIKIDEQGSSAPREYYGEFGGWGLLVTRLKLAFSKAGRFIKVRRVLVRVESAKGGRPLYVRLEPVQEQQTGGQAGGQQQTGQQSGQQGQSNPWWDELMTVIENLASRGEPVGRNGEEYRLGGASLDSGSGEFESPVELWVLVTGPASALREGVRLVACLAGSYGTQSNQVEFTVDLSDVPRIEDVKLRKVTVDNTSKLDVYVKLAGQGSVGVKVEVPDQQGQGLTQVQVSQVTPPQGYTHGFEADIGDSVLAVVTVDVSDTDYRVERVYVWPYDVYLSNVQNVRLSYGNGTTALSADLELTRLCKKVGDVTYKVEGQATVVFDGEPVLSGVSWDSGQSSVTKTLRVPVDPGEHEVMLVFDGKLMRNNTELAKLTCVRVYAWEFDAQPPKVESPSQVLYDRDHDQLVIAAKVARHASAGLTLRYNEYDSNRECLEVREKRISGSGSNPRIVYDNAKVDSYCASDWVVGVIDLGQQGFERLRELVEGGGVARFSLVEDLVDDQNNKIGEIGAAFDVRLSSVSWVYDRSQSSGGGERWVCVDVLPSQDGRGLVVEAWRMDVSVDSNGKITGVSDLGFVGKKVLERCVEPGYVGNNLVVCTRVVGSGKGVSYRQECARVTVDVNNGTVNVSWLSERQGGMVGSSYLTLVFREGDDVVVVVASPDEKRRLVAERLNVQGVRSVGVFGPLVGVETQDGVEWHWVTQSGVDSGVSVRDVREPQKLRGAGKLVVLQAGSGSNARREYRWVARSGERYRGYDVWVVYGPKGRVKVGDRSGYLFAGRIGAVVWVDQQGNVTGVSVVVGGTKLWDSGERVLVLDDGRVLYRKGVIKGQEGGEQVEYGVKYDVFERLGVSGGAVVDVSDGVALCEVSGGGLVPVLLLKDGVRRVDAWDGKTGLGAWRNPSGEGAIVVQVDVSGKRLVCVRLLKEVKGTPAWVGEFGGEWFLVTREGGGLRAYGLVRDESGRVSGVVTPVWSGVVSGRSASVLGDGRLVLLDGKGAVVGVFRLPGGVREVRDAKGDVLSYVDGKGALRTVWVTSGGLVSPVASVEGEKVSLVVFGNGGFAVLGKDGKVVKVGSVAGFKRVVTKGDWFVVCETDGGLRLVTLEGDVVGPRLQGRSVDGKRVLVFEVGGRSVVVGEGGVVVGVVPGRPVLLEGGVLVTGAGAWWVTSGGLASPERVSGGQGRVVGKPVSARVRSLGGGGGKGGPIIPIIPPARRRRRATA